MSAHRTDPGTGDIDAVLEGLANQPRELRPKWTAETSGHERAAFESKAAPVASGHPTAPREDEVILRRSVANPVARRATPTAITPRTTRRQVVVAAALASAIALAVAVVLVLTRPRANESEPERARLDAPAARSTAVVPPVVATQTSVDALPTVIAASTSTTGASSAAATPPVEAPQSVQAPTGRGIAPPVGSSTKPPSPAQPVQKLPNADLYDHQRN